MRIGVVTDSANDLPAELLARASVGVVPLDVRLGSLPVEQARALDPAEFWRIANSTAELAETSAPSPGAFVEAFRRQREAGADAVLCVTISSALSATYEAARQAAVALADEVPVQVVDSRFATMGEGLLVLEAVEQAAKAASLEEAAAAVRVAIGSLEVLGTVDSLEHLRRGGRIGSAQAFIGSMLQVKPVLQVRDGVIEGESRQRTRARSLRYLADKVRDAGPLKRIAVAHAQAADVAEFAALLQPTASTEELIVGYIGPVVGAHTGPGTIAVCLQRR